MYIACADRWLPEYMDLPYEEYAEMLYMYFSGNVDEEKQKRLSEKYDKIIMNTSVADYVWLPLKFEEANDENPDGMVYIDWYDEWRIEDWE